MRKSRENWKVIDYTEPTFFSSWPILEMTDTLKYLDYTGMNEICRKNGEYFSTYTYRCLSLQEKLHMNNFWLRPCLLW